MTSKAEIRWIGGPVLHARAQGVFRIGEAIEVGARRLRGEVIRLKGEELVGQIYEDTTGLRPGDPVHGAGRPLSVRVGPGLLGHIFDGLLRPLDQTSAGDDATKQIPAPIRFIPLIEIGQTLAPGAAFGSIPGLGISQFCLLPPNVGGVVEDVRSEGEFGPDEKLCAIRASSGQVKRGASVSVRNA